MTSGSYAAEDDPADPITRDAEFTLPPEAIELDLLDCDVIPMLIAGMVNGVNVMEFLERLQTLAYTGTHSDSVLSIFLHERFQTMERGQSQRKPFTNSSKSSRKESSKTSPSMPNWPLTLLTKRITVKDYPLASARMNDFLLIFF